LSLLGGDRTQTLAHLLRQRSRRLGERPALHTRVDGRWQATSWASYGQQVDAFARALIHLGVASGDRVGIWSFNRREWHVAAYGAMTAGAVPFGIYTTCSAEQAVHQLRHARARVAVVETEAMLAQLQAQRPSLPDLKEVILLDVVSPLPERVRGWDSLAALAAQVPPEAVDARLDAVKPDQLATLIYTSGTSGPPKGVMLSHHNLRWTAQQLWHTVGEPHAARLLSYLPLSHVAEQLLSMHTSVLGEFEVYFTRSNEAMPEDLAEVRPTFMFGVPRVWEKLKDKLTQAFAAQPPARQQVLAQARRAAEAWHRYTLAGDKVPATVDLAYRVARRAVLRPLKRKIGIDQVFHFATGAAPLGRDVIDFFVGLDVVLLEVYGQSEVTGPTSMNVGEATRLGTLGRPLPGVTVRIADDGEILVKGGNVCMGYLDDPEATAALLQDGWLHSGDVGELDGDGYLRITDRKKDLIVTSTGKKAAPQNLEALLRAISLVAQAVVVGERQPYLTALLTLEPEAARAFARAHGLSEDLVELAQSPVLRDALQKSIAQLNGSLARFEAIQKFTVLPVEFSTASGELTPTLKLKRKAVVEKFAAEIAALYEPK
jgi:long-chain acyl-CoA synthetase